MSVKVSLSIALENNLTYPQLMVNHIGVVVLFKEQAKGIVVYPSTSDYKIGDYSIMWHMASFRCYIGEITLKNE